MQLLWYSAREDGIASWIKSVLDSVFEPAEIKRCGKIDEVEARLRNPTVAVELLLLRCHHATEIARLQSLCWLVHSPRLILLLSRWDSQMLRLGHRLRPNPLLTTDCGLEELAAVLFRLRERSAWR